MTAVAVSIVRCVDDESLPSFVECKLTDRFGKDWTFLEKSAVVTSAYLSRASTYPQPGEIACRLVGSGVDKDGRKFVVVDTAEPWGVEADDGTTCFEVFADCQM